MMFYWFYATILSWAWLTPTPSSTTKLHQIFQEEWKFRTSQGRLFEQSKNGEIIVCEISPLAEQRNATYWKTILKRLETIKYDQLSTEDQVNYRIFKFQLEDFIAEVAFESYLMPLNAEGGFYTNLPNAAKQLPFKTEQDYETYLKRLAIVPKYMDDYIALMRIGIQKGMVQPRIIVEKYKALIEPYLKDNPTESIFYTPLLGLDKTNFSAATKQGLQQRTQTIIQEQLLPTYRKFDQFMAQTYLPAANVAIGAAYLPNGKAYYEQRVQYFTTLSLTPDEIFNIGQREVARIKADMEKIIQELQFKGSFTDFLQFLRTDPQFYAKTPKDLLKEASYWAKKIDWKLPQYFNTLPRLPYGVQPVPAAIAPNYTGGRYSPGSLKNHKAGEYWVNTYKLESRPLYVLPALTLHEAVPGHHLQISLSEELDNLPNFRRNTYLSCYGEGWGLYSEWLGIEADIYETPYEHFGRMTYEMWRACRLVIDVGIHYNNWTRQQAVDFMASNTALSLHEVNTEIDRYIGWPAQALSYKIGELKIRELRQKAEQTLGNAFDIRAFHDVILSHGSVPLFILEEYVEAYIAKSKK